MISHNSSDSKGRVIGEERVIEQVEIVTAAKNRVAFRRTLRGAVYMELARPGVMADGAGWVVSDGYFLEAGDVEKLRDLLRPDQAEGPA